MYYLDSSQLSPGNEHRNFIYRYRLPNNQFDFNTVTLYLYIIVLYCREWTRLEQATAENWVRYVCNATTNIWNSLNVQETCWNERKQRDWMYTNRAQFTWENNKCLKSIAIEATWKIYIPNPYHSNPIEIQIKMLFYRFIIRASTLSPTFFLILTSTCFFLRIVSHLLLFRMS